MNLVFISGRIIEEVKYKFVINRKHVAIAELKIEDYKKQIIQVIIYDNKADYAIKKFKVGDVIYFEGRLNNKMQVEVLEQYKIGKIIG